MKLELKRFSAQSDTTLGLMFLDGEFECFTLEDEYRAEKIKGETRIPEGTYKVAKREVLSGLTKKYREKYPWFDFHFMLHDVPGFQYVYIHIGNDDDHTRKHEFYDDTFEYLKSITPQNIREAASELLCLDRYRVHMLVPMDQMSATPGSGSDPRACLAFEETRVTSANDKGKCTSPLEENSTYDERN